MEYQDNAPQSQNTNENKPQAQNTNGNKPQAQNEEVQKTFAIAGIITLPIKHASLVATIGAVFTVLYLLDLFFDINPLKDMYVKVFPRSADEDETPS